MAFADSVSGRARQAVRLALNEVGRQGVRYIRNLVGVRVQFSGGAVTRSSPGDAPRREPDWMIGDSGRRGGTLWRSIKYRVAPKAATIADLIIYTNDFVAVFMEDGTVHIEPRPFWEKSRQYILQNIASQLPDLIAEKLGQVELQAAAEFDVSDAAADFSADDSAFPE